MNVNRIRVKEVSTCISTMYSIKRYHLNAWVYLMRTKMMIKFCKNRRAIVRDCICGSRYNFILCNFIRPLL